MENATHYELDIIRGAKEIGQALGGLSPRYVYDLQSTGGAPIFILGRRLAMRRSEAIKWIKAQEDATLAKAARH